MGGHLVRLADGRPILADRQGVENRGRFNIVGIPIEG